MLRKAATFLGAFIVLLLAITAARLHFNLLASTGRSSAGEMIETLQNPVAVTSWTTNGLNLADGRSVRIPGLLSLPAESVALAEATKRGVQIDADGRVWGLVRIHHWCGNDPVREHIAKVDLSEMMIFLHEGEPDATISEKGYLVGDYVSTFSEWGWERAEFSHFQARQRMKNSPR